QLFAAAENSGGGRRELEQRLYRRTGLLDRARFQEITKRKEKGNGRSLPELANQNRADNSNADERVNADDPVAQGAHRPADNGDSRDEGRRNHEPSADGIGRRQSAEREGRENEPSRENYLL